MTYQAYAHNGLALLSAIDASNGDELRRQIDNVLFGLVAERNGDELDWSTFRLKVARDEYRPNQLLIESRIVVRARYEGEN